MNNKSLFLLILIGLTVHSSKSMDALDSRATATVNLTGPDLEDQRLLVAVMFGRVPMDRAKQEALVGRILKKDGKREKAGKPE